MFETGDKIRFVNYGFDMNGQTGKITGWSAPYYSVRLDNEELHRRIDEADYLILPEEIEAV